MTTPDSRTDSPKLIIGGGQEGNQTGSSSWSPYGVVGPTGDRLMLPFYKPVKIPDSKSTEVPIIPTLGIEACGGKIISGGALGAVLGVGMGLFFGAMGDVSPIQIVQGREVPQAPLREQMRTAVKSTASKMGGWAKNFGVLTALFGGVECVIEKYRAKHDVWNPVVSGCIVGATCGKLTSLSRTVRISQHNLLTRTLA
jgi:mitochondrial import inner membrane translocase subunit TIM22